MVIKRFRVIKPEIRVLGIDDGKHVFRSKTQAPIVGVVFRGGLWLDGVMSTSVSVDGFDVNRKSFKNDSCLTTLQAITGHNVKRSNLCRLQHYRHSQA